MPRRTTPEQTETARRTRGRPVGDRDAKIGELLKAAREVIAREGCAGASIRKVAERAGYSTGAITYYFADRNDLLARVVEDVFDDFDRWLDPAGNGLLDIRGMLEFQLVRNGTGRDRQLGRQVWLQLLVHAGTDTKLASVIERLYGRFRDRLATLIEQAQLAGTVRTDLPADLLADQISALGDGWMIVQPVERKRFDKRRVARLVDMAITMLQPIGAGSTGSASKQAR